jgi:hypothetical protein
MTARAVDIRDELESLLLEAEAVSVAGWLTVALAGDGIGPPLWLSGQGAVELGLAIGIALTRAGQDAACAPWSWLGGRQPDYWPEVTIAIVGVEDVDDATLRAMATSTALLVVGDAMPRIPCLRAATCHLPANRLHDLRLLAEAGWPL